MARGSQLSSPEREVLEQVYLGGVVWEEQIKSVGARDELIETGFAQKKSIRSRTYTVLTERGQKEAQRLGLSRFFEAS